MQSKQLVQLLESRRRMLTTAFTALCGLIPMQTIASVATNNCIEMNTTHLITALRSIGKPICIDAADRLAGPIGNNAEFDLHLRRADLNEADARILANGMLCSNAGNGLLLKSFSASFNPALGDAGAKALIEAFPETMTELGLVGCSIGDAGGRAILEWARVAPKLEMICVEGNRMSVDLQSQLKGLASNERQMLVVV